MSDQVGGVIGMRTGGRNDGHRGDRSA
jgi:hypothetical protein